MARLLGPAVAALFAGVAFSACAHELTPGEPLPPVNQSCRALCCFEFESPCTTKATFACEGCDDRCRGACVDSGPLLRCMQESSTKFECSPNGTIRPAGEVCAREFDDYQAAADTQCTSRQARVGDGRY